MPPLAGFSDNPFVTRSDVIRGANALLAPLNPYKSPGGARIRLPVATGTHFDETAAQLEGFARPLWAVGALLAGTGQEGAINRTTDPNAIDRNLESWVRGLAAGTDPSQESNGEFWGHVQDMDQRMVEMEIIAFTLLSAKEAFLSSAPGGERVRGNIVAWLRGINSKQMPQTNWLWFRVLTNLALVKSCGVPYEDLKKEIAADLEVLDSFYLGDGWSSDGNWNENGRQADYYSGSFAIQYSQLLFVRYASDLDPQRAEEYRNRAGKFALDFLKYFDEDGAAIPFGRSLTYRFAFAAFWSAAAFAEVKLPAPLDRPGVVKGLMLRHLRWWAKQTNIFYADGTLNIGYGYPNAYLSEDYNSPQSPYWCMKTFVAMELPEMHQFWTCEELPHPWATSKEEPSIAAISRALQITCHTKNHHFLLSSGQFCPWPLKATEAKYGKFAYSSAFAFGVPTGTTSIQQMAPDSSLALSNDEGETWRVRWKPLDARIESRKLLTTSGGNNQNMNITVLVSRWIPWKFGGIEVQTILIPPTTRWPDWHVRVHKISCSPGVDLPGNGKEILSVEGGFAIYGRQKVNGLALPRLSQNLTHIDTATGSEAKSSNEGIFWDEKSSVIISVAGASGVRSLDIGGGESAIGGAILKPDANTNLISQRTLIPTIQQNISLGGSERDKKLEYWFATGVFALVGKRGNGPGLPADELLRRWKDSPILLIGPNSTSVEKDCILF